MNTALSAKKKSYSVLEIVEMASCGTKGNIEKSRGAIMPELQEIYRIMVELQDIYRILLIQLKFTGFYRITGCLGAL